MAVRQGIFIVFLLLAISFAESNPISTKAAKITKEDLKDEDYRLKKNIEAENYIIDLTLNDDFVVTPVFTGTVKIQFKPTETIDDNIIVNAEGMTLDKTKTKLYVVGVPETDLLKTATIPEVPSELHRLPFELKEKLITGTSYILEITYSGTLYKDMYGFYLSSYTQNNKTEWIATTQFQPTYARRAFPCFDEPNFKAEFDISITHPKEYRALSNAEVKSVNLVNDDKSRKTIFSRTPKMSTYLIAFIVSKFASLNVEVDGFQNRVWSQQELIDTAKYSLDIAPKLLKQMEKFTNVPYSISNLPKLDQVAIPDFSAGAMENWGLVTYRESALLWDKAESTAQSKQRVATIVAHELAHMWFGNLFTTDWWDTTWLNEGFARYFQYYATDEVETDWELKHQLVLEQQQSIFISDALNNTNPLTSKALSREQISNKFDSITYNKGASVIRMMEHIMGKEKFFEQIKVYAQGKQLQNVVPDDLWTAMSRDDIPLPKDKEIKDVMEPWTTNPGFPVVDVSIKDSNIIFEAHRFLYNRTETISNNSVWYIPITYTTSKEKKFTDTLPKSTNWIKPGEQLTVTVEGLEDITWIITNIQSSAYMRVNYEENLWTAIQRALLENHEDIHILNRAQIADDSMNLARAHMITYTTALDVLQYLAKETNYYPWYSAFNAFAYLRRRISGELEREMDTYISNLMPELYKSVSFNDKSKKQIDIHKKVLALTWACQLGNQDCIEIAQELFNLLKENETPVQPDIRSVVYCTAIRNSDGDDNWAFLWDRYTHSNMATEGTIILSALGCSKDPEILQKYLNKTITENSGIRQQDAQAVFSAVISNNHEGVQVGLDFVVNNYAEIQHFYGGINALSGVITSLADRLTTADEIQKFEEFVEAANLGTAQDSADNALERCNENLQWVESFGPELLQYLKQKNAGPTTTTSTTTPKPGGASSVTVSSAVFLLSIFAIITKW